MPLWINIHARLLLSGIPRIFIWRLSYSSFDESGQGVSYLMGPALERLLARPSTLRLLRNLVQHERHFSTHDLSTTVCSRLTRHSVSTPQCSRNGGPRRPGSSRSSLLGVTRRHASTDSHDVVKLVNACDTLQELLAASEDPYQELEFEADIHNTKRRPQAFRKRLRLVNQLQHRQDWALWAELLQFRRRIDGDEGVAQLWRRLVTKRMPTEGPTADIIWKQILQTANRGKAISLSEVLEKAVELRAEDGRQSNVLYPTIMSYVFRHRPEDATIVFRDFRKSLGLPADAITSLVEDVQSSSSGSAAWQSFKQIYSLHKDSNKKIYDHVATTLFRIGTDLAGFYRWHTFLIRNNDLPSTSMRTETIVQACLARDHEEATFFAQNPKSESGVERLTDAGLALLTRRGMSRHVGEAHGVKETSLSDNFCARLFATTSFSLDFVFGSIYMFGADTLGPLAVREMALRSENTVEYLETLHKARIKGLRIAKNTFSEVLRISANEGQSALFNFIVNGDFHPEALGSSPLQVEIVKRFITQGALAEAHSFLKVVSPTLAESHTWSWNELARAYCLAKDHSNLSRVMVEMRRIGVKFDFTIVRLMKQVFLSRRAASKRPEPSGKDETLDYDVFVSKHMQLILEGGQGDLDAGVWREMLKRFGMTGRISELQDLTLYLAQFYGPRREGKLVESSWLEYEDRDEISQDIPNKDPPSSRSGQALFDLRTPLKHLERDLLGTTDHTELFGVQMQRAIVSWAFWHESYNNNTKISSFRSRRRHLQTSSFARGLQLLRRLEEAGIRLYVHHIREEVRKCLFKLYGPGFSMRPRIRRLQAINRFSLDARFALIEKAWQRLDGPYRWETLSQDTTSLAKSKFLYHYLFKEFMETPRLTKRFSVGRLQWVMNHALQPELSKRPSKPSMRPSKPFKRPSKPSERLPKPNSTPTEPKLTRRRSKSNSKTMQRKLIKRRPKPNNKTIADSGQAAEQISSR